MRYIVDPAPLWSDFDGTMVAVYELSDERIMYIAQQMIGLEKVQEHPTIDFELKRRGLHDSAEISK